MAETSEWIGRAERIVGFTGAGISTESGVPDFRGADGVWRRLRIVTFGEFLASEASRIEYWRQKAEGWPLLRAARPNAGHAAFVDLYRRGKLSALITQNIERLHQRAGLPPEIVVELHGTATETVCLDCGDRISSDEAYARFSDGEQAPRCRSCGGLLKSATVSFGQNLDADVIHRAREAAMACDLMLVVGSSLVVEPAASIPRLAKRAGARVVIINRDETAQDDIADTVIRGEIGTVLPAIVAGIR